MPAVVAAGRDHATRNPPPIRGGQPQTLPTRIVVGSVAATNYRYELRRDDEVVATGHLSREQPLEVGRRLEIGGQPGIVRTIEPLLGEQELRLVVQLVRDRN